MLARNMLLLSVSAVALAACQTVQDHELVMQVDPEVEEAFLADKPAELHRLYRRVLLEGERNRVLNQARAGLAAFEIGDDETAARSFDEALDRIEAIYADNATAEEARSKFVKENIKDFKGEPYERAMAYYYRGLVYLHEGDFENARASFRGGMLQDTMAADEAYIADFASLAFLDGWSSHCLGRRGLAADAFAEAAGLRPELQPPPPGDRLLLILETGTAPVKVATGTYGEMMRLEPGTEGPDDPVFLVGEYEVPAVLAEDVFWQASTRGGRQVQAILDGKADFKAVTDTLGELGLVTGLMALDEGNQQDDPNMRAVGAAIMLAGLFAKGLAAATRPEADLRYWDNLPDKIYFATLPYTDVPITVSDGGRAIPVTVRRGGSCALGWARTHSALSVDDVAPNAIGRR